MDSQEIDALPIIPSQPSSSQRRPQDEEPCELRRRRRIPSNKSLVIIFDVEPVYKGRPERVFVGQFHNKDTKVHAWSQLKGLRYYRWLQGPMNHLPREKQLKYIVDITRHFFNFLHIY